MDTAETAQQWLLDHYPHAAPAPCYGPAYGAACLGMYREEVPANLFWWTWSFPRFYGRALNACRNHDLPINGATFLPPLPRPKWLRPAAAWLLEPLSAAGPWLFALGAVVCLLRPGERGRSLCLSAFSVYYSAALFFVLPELKHAGPLVLPLAVFGGIGLASPRFLIRGVRLIAKVRELFRPALRLAGAAVLLTTAWALVCVAAYAYSRESRRELLAAVMRLARTGQSEPDALRGPRLFSVTLHPERGDRPTGYLLRIAAGAEASHPRLECRRLRHEQPLAPARLFFTRHRLHPGREQCFFVTCNPGAPFGEVSPLVCTALLEGDARFLSCTRVDLADWRRLPLCTVFVPGECDPGNPLVDGVSGATQYADNPELNNAGLSFAELASDGGAPPAALFPSADGPSVAELPPEGWRVVAPGCETERVAEGLRVRAPAGSYAAETPLLTAPADGTYYFRLRFRPEAGRLSFGALSQDRRSWLAIRWGDDPAGADAERVLTVQLRAGEKFSLVTADGGSPEGSGSVFLLEALSACRDGSDEPAVSDERVRSRLPANSN